MGQMNPNGSLWLTCLTSLSLIVSSHPLNPLITSLDFLRDEVEKTGGEIN